jgi:hypothetical protein
MGKLADPRNIVASRAGALVLAVCSLAGEPRQGPSYLEALPGNYSESYRASWSRI